MPRTARILTLVAAASALLVACPDNQVTHSRVAKEEAAPAPSLAAAPMAPMPSARAAPPGMKGDVPVPPKPTGAEGLTWTLPKGWTQTLSGGIRYATLKPAGAGNLDASVVVLPGQAGGDRQRQPVARTARPRAARGGRAPRIAKDDQHQGRPGRGVRFLQ